MKIILMTAVLGALLFPSIVRASDMTSQEISSDHARCSAAADSGDYASLSVYCKSEAEGRLTRAADEDGAEAESDRRMASLLLMQAALGDAARGDFSQARTGADNSVRLINRLVAANPSSQNKRVQKAMRADRAVIYSQSGSR